MKINYVDYKHSYAHALEPKLKALNFHANVDKKPIQYCRKIVMNALKQNEVKFTEKEQEFFDTVQTIETSSQLYFYCKNCVKKAREVFVNVDETGELII